MEQEAEDDVVLGGVVVMVVVRAWRSRTGRWRACPSRPCSCSTTGRQAGRATGGWGPWDADGDGDDPPSPLTNRDQALAYNGQLRPRVPAKKVSERGEQGTDDWQAGRQAG